MKKATALIMLISLTATAGCLNFNPPVGYARLQDPHPYRVRATSSEGSAVTVSLKYNHDPERGDVAYWINVTKSHLTKAAGYTFVKAGDFKSGQGPGRWMLFEKKVKGADYLYLVGVVVDYSKGFPGFGPEGHDLYVLEAGGEKAVFEKDVENMIKAFETLD